MKTRLQILRHIIEGGYLLITKPAATVLKEIILLIEKKEPVEFKSFDNHQDDPIYISVWNELITEYKKLGKVGELKKNEVKDSDFFKRISMVNSYIHLAKKYQQIDENILTKITESLEKEDDTNKFFSNGLSAIEKYTYQFNNGLSLRNAVAYVWSEIATLPQDKIADAKIKFSKILAEIEQVSSSNVEIILGRLLECLALPDIQNKNDIAKLLRTRFYSHLKEEIHHLAVTQQVGLLQDFSQSKKENKFEEKFSKEINKILSEELLSFELIPGITIQADVEKELKMFFGNTATQQIRTILLEELKKSATKPVDKLHLLKAFVESEKKDKCQPWVFLQKLIVVTQINEQDRINQLCDRYQRLQRADHDYEKFEAIQSKRNSPQFQTALHALDEPIKTTARLFKEFYEDCRWIQEKTSPSTKSNFNVTSLESKLKHYEDIVEKFREQEKNLYHPDFKFPAKYQNMTQTKSKSQDTLQKVSEIFKDYASGIVRKFHWGRTHKTEAMELVKKMADFKSDHASGDKIKEAQNYIRDVLNRLILKNQLNLKGSFSRRAQYCLDLLKTESSAFEMETRKRFQRGPN